MTARGSARRWTVAAGVVVVVAFTFTLPPVRRLAGRFFGSLREPQVQAVNVNLSNFFGPDANQTLQQMVTQMVSDKVTVTTSQKSQPAQNAAEASRLAGFPVALPAGRKDAPVLTVVGEHAFTLTVDRARLQAIVKEAGRPDLAVPASIDGAAMHVQIPRSVRARYGECPAPRSAAANVVTPPPSSTQYDNCLILSEGPRPAVQAPAGLDLEPLAQIGLEVAGMTSDQARHFLQTVNWQAILGLPVPRFMRSYESVKVGNAEGTLFNLAGRRGPTYTLIWTDRGLVYALAGYGNSSDAVALANSLR
ncbi:MAG TPA: hypothetical protein VND92_05145 [Vicinamibacterales bacterium]|nr:hypothetical protein [Vicinamibacterales bacterium]